MSVIWYKRRSEEDRNWGERRKHRRIIINRPGLVCGADNLRVECTVIDVSAGGARIRVDAPKQVPDEFTLWLSRSGATRRLCEVAWRSNDEIGVRFRPE